MTSTLRAGHAAREGHVEGYKLEDEVKSAAGGVRGTEIFKKVVEIVMKRRDEKCKTGIRLKTRGYEYGSARRTYTARRRTRWHGG